MTAQSDVMLTENGPLIQILASCSLVELNYYRNVCKIWKTVCDALLEPFIELRDHICECIEDFSREKDSYWRYCRRIIKDVMPDYLELPLPDEVFTLCWALHCYPYVTVCIPTFFANLLCSSFQSRIS
jgi:hypothetical protein